MWFYRLLALILVLGGTYQAQAMLGPDVIGATSIEMGSAGTTDTTVTRSSAGVLAVEGVPLTGGGGAQTPWASDINGAGFNLTDAGGLVVNHTAKLTTFSSTTPDAQFNGTTAASRELGLANWSASSGAGGLVIAKSRGASVGTYTDLVNGDSIGIITFMGVDGSAFSPSASIAAFADDEHGASGDTPGGLMFATTADGTTTLTNRWRIGDAGELIGPAGSGPQTQFSGTTNTPTVEVLGIASNDSAVAIARFSNGATPSRLYLGKSRGATVGTYTPAPTADDQIGEINFQAADGTDMSDIAAIRGVSDGSSGSNDTPGRLEFATTLDSASTFTTRMTIKNDGSVLVGNSTGATTSVASGGPATGRIQSNLSDNAYYNYSATFFSNDSIGPAFSFGKSRNSTIGSHTVVNDGDVLGSILFQGSDGDQFHSPARIRGVSDGSSSDNDTPGRLEFHTIPDASTTLTLRMTIKADGGIIVGNATASSGRGSIILADSAPTSGAGGLVRLAEDTDNGANYKGFLAPATITANQDCTFEDDANFIPDSCVGDGSDASDERLKTDFHPAGDVGPMIDQIKVYDFKWNADAPSVAEMVRKGQSGFGVKAQELYKINPDLVHVGGEDPLKDPWTWKPEKLVPYLLVEIQDLRKRVAELENK